MERIDYLDDLVDAMMIGSRALATSDVVLMQALINDMNISQLQILNTYKSNSGGAAADDERSSYAYLTCEANGCARVKTANS